jgi:hypothetical protein
LGFCYAKIACAIQPWEKGVLRFSAGRGNEALMFCRKSTAFISSRTLILDTKGKIYGLNLKLHGITG